MLEMPRAMRARLLWCITLFLLCHPRLGAQRVTSEFPPSDSPHQASPEAAAESVASLPDDPSQESSIPEAHVVREPQAGVPVRIIADTQTRQSLRDGNLYTLEGNVVIYYRRYIVHADHATYNDGTGRIDAQGHLMVDGGPDDEHFVASHGWVNVQQDTGDFFDVVGTIGARKTARGRMVFTAPNPFTVTGREVMQLGRGHYRVVHGSMTSCRLPQPDWRILSHVIELNSGVAKTSNGIFELFHVPVFYLPYVTHPVGEQRASGILLPYYGFNNTYGQVVGTGFYVTLGRSADLTLATQYYSKRGFAPNGLFRYRGRGEDFVKFHFQSLLDHGLLEPNGTRLNQGGADVIADGRYDLSPDTRAVVDAEYLSSYVYRLAFEEIYAIAIDSEVKSQLFVTREHRDMWASLRANRYQNFQNANITGDEVRILHLPQIDVEAADHWFGGEQGRSPLMWGFTGSAGALSRYDYPSFRSTAEIPRVDFYPRLSMPLHFDGWTFKPEAAFRETWYGKSQKPANLEQIPIVRKEGISRTDAEAGFEFRPPAVERDFTAPWLEHLLGGELRHVVEPYLHYRYVTGINNFRQILRFDETDVASNTNELEYALLQRVFLRSRRPETCGSGAGAGNGGGEAAPLSASPTSVAGWDVDSIDTLNGVTGTPASALEPECGGQTKDWISWLVAQKYYFNPDFGGAITRDTPNPLVTTLDFTGVDFLTEPRNTTPVISRLRMRTTRATDVEWDLDYDVKEGKITSSNVFSGYQRGLYRFQFGDSYVNVPLGYTPLTTARTTVREPTPSSPFNQIHAAALYGAANKVGLSAGVNVAYDLVHQALQYGAVQGDYNWNCCGFSFQYRRFSLGPIRDDTEYFYSLNFAGFGNVGDLTHRITLF